MSAQVDVMDVLAVIRRTCDADALPYEVHAAVAALIAERDALREEVAVLRQQPAIVVDDAMVDAAIAAHDAHWADDANYPARAPRSMKGIAELHDKLVRDAIRAALTAAFARAQGVSPE